MDSLEKLCYLDYDAPQKYLPLLLNYLTAQKMRPRPLQPPPPPPTHPLPQSKQMYTKKDKQTASV